ncbi:MULTISPECIES: T9SS type A sorting domain-containing protein [Niastella]|uniref:T9SS type A sorting domain-containing protein n=1 Tax=Niastella soli TaxID=2821487 RepID=A0ABS3YTJ6_9BACT|nr:T9SS type A sorting domain-containing protein [Niastella soli]MBO9201242.1 T9SS type A sorting domain-containing protein [Niastella soli]
MKKIYSLIMVSVIAITTNAQLIFNEAFPYPNPNLGTQGSWVQNGSGQDVQITSTNPLIYPNYLSGAEYATVGAVSGTDPHKLLNQAISTQNADLTIYMSFVVRVTSMPAASNGTPAYSIALENTADPDRPLRFYIASEPGNSNEVQFGLLTGNLTMASRIVWTPTTASFTTGTTYLIVIRYDISSAPGNDDDAYLWVNPSLTSEPAIASANMQILDVVEANYGNLINAIELNQNSSTTSPVAAFDAIRIAYGPNSAIAWFNLDPAASSLPVVLTSFNATEDGLSTKLIWNTTQESDIANYVIEKSTDGRTFNAIGTVKGTNQKAYSFVDAQSNADNSYYRLKMVDLDGSFKYSYIVSFRSKMNMNISLSPNPVKNNLMVQHPKVTTEGHIQIISFNGQVVKDLKLAANAVISNIDMSGFSNGLYHVEFRNGSDMFSKTVIKQ